ncbi:YehR family lipoprotein [Gracilibacillus timonensis]|uniref:YehR family lipoprotein n=1 Tax=Gracilibacillus timonensis TaxID=1816696 RepID=UPI000824C154|nr:YehR family protein [Gracilibacillus timonensis]
MNKWLMFCLTLLLSVALVACGSDDADSDADTGSDNETTEDAANNEEDADGDTDEAADDTTTEEEPATDEEPAADANEEPASSELDIDPNGQNEVTIEMEQGGAVSTVTYLADGDMVTEQTAYNETPYSALGVADKEEAEAALQADVEAYQSTEGVTHEIEYQDDKLIEEVTVDYQAVDFEQLAQLTGSSFEGNVENGISLQRSVEMLLNQGYQLVE